MGNLCSSGTDRSEKKEDKQLPKAKDGEDEALLSKVGEAAEAVEVREGDDQKAGGLTGIVGGVVSSGEAAVSDVVETAQDQGQKVVAEGKELATEALEKGKEAAVAAKDAVVAGVTGVATEVKESADQKASDVADDVSTKVETGQQSVSGFVGDVGAQASAAATEVSNQTKEDVAAAVQSGKEQSREVTAGIESRVEAAKEETISAVESSKTEAANLASQVEGEVAAVKSSAEENVAESPPSSGFLDSVKQTVQEKAEDVKVVAVEKGQEAKQTAEDYLSQAVETAKASAVGTFASFSESGTKQLDDVKDTTSETVKDIEDSISGAQNNVQSGLAESQGEVEQIQSSVSASLESAADNTLSSIPNEKEVEGITTGTNSAIDALASDLAGAEKSLSDNVEAIRSTGDLPPPPPSPPALDTQQSQKDDSNDSGSGLLGNFGGVASGAVATGVGFVGEKIVDKVQDLVGGQDKKEVTEPVVEGTQQSSEETAPPTSDQNSGLMGGFGSVATGAVQTGVGVVSEKIIEKAQDIFGVKEEKESEGSAPAPDQPASAGLSATDVLESSTVAFSEEVADKGRAMFGDDTKVEAAEEPVMRSEGQPDVAAMPPESLEESDFLEKAKSLLEQHRNSLDGTRMAAQAVELAKDRLNDSETNTEEVVNSVLADLSNNNNVEESPVSDEVTDKAREETARDFVEGIIDKATSIVSESMAKEEGQNGEESPTSPDPCVDHAEETMEPKKRGVCFASPQISSDQSFSSLSSPPEISPPPPQAAHDTDLSPPSEASSISQGELVERDIELELPSSPPQSTTEDSGASPDDDASPDSHEQDLLDNRRVLGMEEADESLQRIAMEVTTKAVQDAIKIVTENGTGATTNINDLGISSPSSGGDQEEEMTTTDSSQVERGSSVSDLTDTSQQGSIADSLSSYDPGAVYRQDLADLSDTAAVPSPVDTTTATTTTSAASSTTAPTTTITSDNKAGDSSTYLENEAPGSLTETPTPTNPSSFSSDDNSQQQQSSTEPTADGSIVDDDSTVAPSSPLSVSQSEVPSTFPTPLNEAMAKQPTIVINSPDSAPNTNGSVEDVAATSSSEALI